eukprot:TRINITY_DN1279_c0_g1_i7.p1 TRINITY_DN1279_c0_g1~~TRINITY_DN1279_c0_g1_i7.p1  ORF type:complete len:392 (+),score=33.17 TRINITY_DN1279_c0_g1_i7:100-1275(+)
MGRLFEKRMDFIRDVTSIVFPILRSFGHMFFGFLLYKYQILSKEATKEISHLVLKLLLPIYMFSKIGILSSPDTLQFIFPILTIVLLCIAVGIGATYLSYKYLLGNLNCFLNVYFALNTFTNFFLLPLLTVDGICQPYGYLGKYESCKYDIQLVLLFTMMMNVYVFTITDYCYETDSAKYRFEVLERGNATLSQVLLPRDPQENSNISLERSTIFTSPNIQKNRFQEILGRLSNRSIICSIAGFILGVFPPTRALFFAEDATFRWSIDILYDLTMNLIFTNIILGYSLAETYFNKQDDGSPSFLNKTQFLYIVLTKLVAVPIIGFVVFYILRGFSEFFQDPVYAYSQYVQFLTPSANVHIMFAIKHQYAKKDVSLLLLYEVQYNLAINVHS